MYMYAHGPAVPVKHEVDERSRYANARLIEEMLGKELKGITLELDKSGYINKYTTQVYGKKNWVCPIHHCIHSSNNWVASQPHAKKKVHVQVGVNNKRTLVNWVDFLPDAELFCYHKCKASCKHNNVNVQKISLNGPLLF
jgi:hypothetical protein